MDGGIFRSGDGGASWTRQPSPGDDLEVYALEALEGTLLAGTPEGVYQAPTDGGNWGYFNRPELSDSPALSLWTYLGYLYIGSQGRVYRSIDQGATWSELKSGIPSEARITCFAGIVKIAVAGSENHGLFYTESMDWTPTGLEGADQQIRDLEVHGNSVYAVTAHGVVESGNLGVDWSPIAVALPGIACLLGDGDAFYAGTDKGVYVSADKGKVWKPFNQGLPENANIHSLEKWGEHLYAATDAGVWRADRFQAGVSNRLSRPSTSAPKLKLQGPRLFFDVDAPYSDPRQTLFVDGLGRTFGPRWVGPHMRPQAKGSGNRIP